jgi:3-hydroxyacyl-CoA dehydrogenase
MPIFSISLVNWARKTKSIQLMKVVEVIRTNETDPIVLERGVKWVEEIGKVSVLCDDTPGMFLRELSQFCFNFVI